MLGATSCAAVLTLVVASKLTIGAPCTESLGAMHMHNTAQTNLSIAASNGCILNYCLL